MQWFENTYILNWSLIVLSSLVPGHSLFALRPSPKLALEIDSPYIVFVTKFIPKSDRICFLGTYSCWATTCWSPNVTSTPWHDFSVKYPERSTNKHITWKICYLPDNTWPTSNASWSNNLVFLLIFILDEHREPELHFHSVFPSDFDTLW